MSKDKKIERTSAGMKDALFLAWEKMISGDITPQDAREQCRLSNAIVSVARVELDHRRFVSRARTKNISVGSIAMVSNDKPIDDA